MHDFTRPLLQAHHNTIGYLCARVTVGDTEQTILEPRPRRYIVINSTGLQPATPADAESAIRLDLLDVVLRAQFLGLTIDQLGEVFDAILAQVEYPTP